MKPGFALFMFLLFKVSVWVSAALFLVIGAAALRLVPAERRWILQVSFAIGLFTILAFVVAVGFAIERYGGFGMNPSGYIPTAILLIESAALGILGFRTAFRFSSVILGLIGLKIIISCIWRNVPN